MCSSCPILSAMALYSAWSGQPSARAASCKSAIATGSPTSTLMLRPAFGTAAPLGSTCSMPECTKGTTAHSTEVVRHAWAAPSIYIVHFKHLRSLSLNVGLLQQRTGTWRRQTEWGRTPTMAADSKLAITFSWTPRPSDSL